MQKSDGDVYCRVSLWIDQAFGVHRPGFVAALRLAIVAWIDHADGPALPIFDGRAAIRIEQIAFVEDRVGNLAHLIVLHAPASSVWVASRRVKASSQVGKL